MIKFKSISKLIALPHTIFALPFSVAGFIFAQHKGAIIQNRDTPSLLLLVILAVFLARTAAMSFNRFADAKIDALNPRTKNREIPMGVISKNETIIICLSSVISFFYVCYLIGPHCLKLSPIVILILLFYSITKRFTSSAHLFLGLSLSLAPGGAWWTIRPEVELLPLVLMTAVFFWVSGFDILYSCQDILFDRKNKIFSIPAIFGITRAFYFSRSFHLICFLLFVAIGFIANLGLIYYVGMLLIGVFLLSQHLIISPYDLKKINHSFFTLNGFISIAYLIILISDLYLLN